MGYFYKKKIIDTACYFKYRGCILRERNTVCTSKGYFVIQEIIMMMMMNIVYILYSVIIEVDFMAI